MSRFHIGLLCLLCALLGAGIMWYCMWEPCRLEGDPNRVSRLLGFPKREMRYVKRLGVYDAFAVREDDGSRSWWLYNSQDPRGTFIIMPFDQGDAPVSFDMLANLAPGGFTRERVAGGTRTFAAAVTPAGRPGDLVWDTDGDGTFDFLRTPELAVYERTPDGGWLLKPKNQPPDEAPVPASPAGEDESNHAVRSAVPVWAGA